MAFDRIPSRRFVNWTTSNWIGPATILVACVFSIGWSMLEPASSNAYDDKKSPKVAELDGFATSQSCRSCHSSEYSSWHASFHRTMTQVATAETVIPEMDGVELRNGGRVYSILKDDERYFVSDWSELEGEDSAGSAREIVMLTGSHHQQNFWLETDEGRALEPFPFGWLIESKRWAPLTDTFMCPPEINIGRAVASWNTMCINCHSTGGRIKFDTESATFDTQVAELGIACESCHSEAEEHVDKHHNPFRRYLARLDGTADESIVNPARLDAPASALACGQCHSVWAFDSMESIAEISETGLNFRAGNTEFVGRFLVQPGSSENVDELNRLNEVDPNFIPDTFWPDGMLRVTGREYNGISTSACFEGGMMSCVSCHEMHPADTSQQDLLAWSNDQLKPRHSGNQACLECHEDIGADLSAHTFHAPESVGSSCYECHMPRTTYGLLGAVRSHRITIPTAQESVDTGRPNACNLCHLDKSLSWTSNMLVDWYGENPIEGLNKDDAEVAAGAVWMLRGDAAQRAIAAWAMGQSEAHAAAGSSWMAPYLAIALNDSYSAVRFISAEALKKIPNFGNLDFDYIAEESVTFEAAVEAFARARSLVRDSAEGQPAASTLIDSGGGFEPETYERLLDQRDQRRVYLVE